MENKDNGKSNQGFSLIEVIVVVLIIGLLSTVTIMSISYAYGSNAKRTADKISSLLDLTRTQSMSMVDGSILFRLQKDLSGNLYGITIQTSNHGGVLVEEELAREELCNSVLELFYTSGAVDTKFSSGNYIDLYYKKSSGAFISNVSQLKLVGSKSATIILVKETGRNYVQ